MSKFCPYCGTPYATETARFCSKCGRAPEHMTPAGQTPAPAAAPARTARVRQPRPVAKPHKGFTFLFSLLAFLTLTVLLLVQTIRLGLSDDMVRSAVGRIDIGALPVGGLVPGAAEGSGLAESLEGMLEELPAQIRDYYDLDESSIEEALASKKVKDWFVKKTTGYLNALMYGGKGGKIDKKDILELFNVIGKELDLPDLGDEFIQITKADEKALKIYDVDNSFTDTELTVIRTLFTNWFSILLGVLAFVFVILAMFCAGGRFLHRFGAPGVTFLISGILVLAAAIVGAFLLPDAVASIAADAGESVGTAVKSLMSGIGFYGCILGGGAVVLGVLCILLRIIGGRSSRD